VKKSELDLKIRNLVKLLLKKNGQKYKELAQFLDVHESPVKQMMVRGGISVERLESIALFFRLSPVELLKLAQEVETAPFQFDLNQERILASEPLCILILFYLSAGFSLGQIKLKLNLPEKLISKCLIFLDKCDLLTYRENQFVKMKVSGPFRFLKNGPVNTSLRKRYLNSLKDQIFPNQNDEVFQRTFEMYMTKTHVSDLKISLNNLINQFAEISRLDKSRHRIEKLEVITGLHFVAPYDGWGEFIKSLY
jgi:hypothetical protein